MKETIVKCKCDYCNGDMSEYDYENAVNIFIKANAPDPKGRCGNSNGIYMRICSDCSQKLDIIPEKIFNGTMGETNRIESALEKCKTKIVDMFFNKKS